MKTYDVAIIGGGAAGLAAAGVLVARGRRVVILDMGSHMARKVAASGGGRCNFTNLAAAHTTYFGKNPNFVRGALSRVTPTDILAWARNHNLGIVEKAAGQYFCADGAAAFVRCLIQDAHGADIKTGVHVDSVSKSGNIFTIATDGQTVAAQSVIIATGGISFSALGVSDAGYKIARAFGHKIEPPRPALCAINTNAFPSDWAGVAMPVTIKTDKRQVADDMLFTHFGIGGPAAYRASIAGADTTLHINLMPGVDAFEYLRDAKQKHGKKSLQSVLALHIPVRIARHFGNMAPGNIADVRDDTLRQIARQISDIALPAGAWRHHGLTAAEVTFGGVDTRDISSKTMESKLCPGLFFAGEVMDVTGDLGGFNLHWAWASGRVAGENA